MHPLLRPLLLATLATAPLGNAGAARQVDGLPAHPREIPVPSLAPYSPPRPAEHVLASGPRVLLFVDRELPLVDGRLRFRAGSLHEPAEAVGLASVLAEVLRSGGAGGEAGLPGPELDAWLDARGAELTIESGLEQLEIAFSCLRADLPLLLERIAALLREPLYPEEALERALQRLRTEIARRDDDASSSADRLLLQVVHGADSPFARVPDEASAARIDRQSLLDYHRAHLGSDRLLVGLAGDLVASDALALLERSLADLGPVGPPPEVGAPAFRQPARTTIYLQDRPGVPQTQVRMAAPGVRRLDEDAAPLRLFTLAVGAGGFANRMMLRVRTELGLAYDVGAAFTPGWQRRGLFRAWGATRNEAVGEALEAMLGVLRGGLAPLGAEELESARTRDAQLRLAEFADPPAILERALDLAFHGYPASFWESQARRLRETDASQVAAAAARHLDPGRLVIVAVGPAAEIAERLAALAPLERLGGPAGDSAERAAQRRLEGLLAAVGGREAWAQARFLEIQARVTAQAGELETRYETRVWQDLAGPRLRAVHRLEGVDSSLVLTPEGGRMRYGDTLQNVPEVRHRQLLLTARRDLLRLLHLAAAGRVEARIGAAGELVLSSPEGLELALELDEAGLPRLARAQEDGREVRYRYEGWTPAGQGLRHPTRIQREGEGPWTREILRFETHPHLEDGLFERP